jgi:Ca-activated chloride channel family protein
MKFLWPDMLWLLVALPALVALYVFLLRRKKKAALRYASLSMVREATGAASRVRRHVPPLLFLFALALMIAAIARPTAIVMTPAQHRTVILAIDVSGSMRATDVKPTRLGAAQTAAKAFVEDQPGHARIGVVSFAATASVVQAPTQNREEIVAAIDRFQLQRGTATGSGIMVALATLLPDADIDVSELIYGRNAPRALPADPAREAKRKAFKPVPPGSYTSGAIILLSDGQRTSGPDPLEAAKRAAEHGVRVFTVGVGTPKGEVLGFEGWSFRARLDEESLKAIANATRGEYFYAGNELELKNVYENLNSRLVFEKRETEITALFAAAAALAALVSAGLSMLWFNRIL